MDTSELDRLTRWLMEGARSAPTPPEFLKQMCERLVAAGLPLYRVGAFVQTLHPDVFGRSFVWREGSDEIVVTTANVDLPDSPRFNAIDKERASFLIAGFGSSEADYDIKVENTKTGAAVRVTADQPLIKMNLWSVRSVMAIEPYIGIELAPGAIKRWTYTYTYKAPARSAGAGNKASVFPVR